MKPRKIVHVTSVHEADDIRIFQKECRTLASAGYEVTLIAPHKQDEVVDGVRIHAIRQPKSRWERMIRTTWLALKACLAEDAILYHIHDPEMLPAGRVLRLAGKWVVYDMHEDLTKQVLSKGWIPSVLRKPVSFVASLALRILLWNTPAVFPGESFTRDYAWIRNHVVVRNMPILDVLEAIEEPRHSVPTLGYIGVVGTSRGTTITLEALRVLNERKRTVHFECVGPTNNTELGEAGLLQLVNKYGLDGVHLYGYLPPEEAWHVVAQCHIGLALLQPLPNYIEAYPTKLFEYMALGIPVIVSDFPLYKGIVEEAQCGIAVNPADAEAIASAIEWLVDHPHEAELMGAHGREAVNSRYSWRLEASKLLEFYEKLLN